MKLFAPFESKNSLVYSIGDNSETFDLIVLIKFEHVAKVNRLKHTVSTIDALISYARNKIGSSKFLSLRHKVTQCLWPSNCSFANGG